MAQTLAVAETAANVRAELGRAGLSGARAARDLRWSQSRLFRRLSGQIPFDIAELSALAEYLDIPLTQLLGGVAA